MNNKQRILFIEPCFVDFGGYFRAINICMALSKKNIKIDLLVGSKKEFQWTIKKTKLNENLTQYELPRFNFHFFFNGRILRGLIALLFGLFRKYDITHACVPVQLESNIPAFFLKLFRKKLIMDWDDYWEGSIIYGEYRIMKAYVSFCERKAPKFFENIIVVSNFLKNLSEKRGAKKVLKLINGVNGNQFTTHSKEESREKLNLDKNGKYLISFGHTYIKDRAYLLFKTFEYIYKLDPSIKLLFNCDPQKIIAEQKLEKKIDANCLKNIINVGYIKQEDLGYYLGACNAAIFLVGDSDNERACFPIRIGSYLNGEAIIIMNDINSEAGNILKNLNCAIIQKDLKLLAQETNNILQDENLYHIKKINTIKAKNELLWENLIDDLIDYYNILIKN